MLTPEAQAISDKWLDDISLQACAHNQLQTLWDHNLCQPRDNLKDLPDDPLDNWVQYSALLVLKKYPKKVCVSWGCVHIVTKCNPAFLSVYRLLPP